MESSCQSKPLMVVLSFAASEDVTTARVWSHSQFPEAQGDANRAETATTNE